MDDKIGEAVLDAARRGNIDVFGVLIKTFPKYINYEKPDWTEATPLRKAVEAGCKPIVEFLLNQGVDVRADCDKSLSALSHAIHVKSMPLCELLISRGARITDKVRISCQVNGTCPDFLSKVEELEREKVEPYLDLLEAIRRRIQGYVVNDDYTYFLVNVYSHKNDRNPYVFRTSGNHEDTKKLEDEEFISRINKKGARVIVVPYEKYAAIQADDDWMSYWDI